MARTVREIIKNGQERLEEAGKDGASFDARALLSFVMDIPFREMPLHYSDDVTDDQAQGFIELIDRRLAGEPLQYITHEQEFMGLTFYVDERVLIPRLDTEILVQEALGYVREANGRIDVDGQAAGEAEGTCQKQIRMLDLCCGSGAVGLSVVKLADNTEGELSDISEDALEVAKINAEALGVEDSMKLVKSDLFEMIEGSFDLILSNPPYVKSDVIRTLDSEVKDHEPMLALDGGADGLDIYRRIIKEAPTHLKRGGCLMMEIGFDQADDIRLLLKECIFTAEMDIVKDLAGHDRVVKIRLD